MNWKTSLKVIIIGILFISLFINVSLVIQNNQLKNKQQALNNDLNELSNTITQKESNIEELNSELVTKDQKIGILNKEIIDLKYDLLVVENQLEETTDLYEEALPYQDRVSKGQDMDLFYPLLSDYETFVRPIVFEELGLSKPTTPKNDYELWQRAKKVYDWISDNYAYCGDRGLRVGSTFSQFQFFSPDELLSVDNHWCGDCDDFATLFAGMLYSSGVSSTDVYMVCGKVDQGGHCWNNLVIDDNMYVIDPVCSMKTQLFNLFGFTWSKQTTEFPDSVGDVTCLDNYDPDTIMNYEEIIEIK